MCRSEREGARVVWVWMATTLWTNVCVCACCMYTGNTWCMCVRALPFAGFVAAAAFFRGDNQEIDTNSGGSLSLLSALSRSDALDNRHLNCFCFVLLRIV